MIISFVSGRTERHVLLHMVPQQTASFVDFGQTQVGRRPSSPAANAKLLCGNFTAISGSNAYIWKNDNDEQLQLTR
jgi:hypothetical protein